MLAAADVLYRNGYDATTMKDIAGQVNLTAASLYHHFRNKDTLLLAVLERGLEKGYSYVEPVACDSALTPAEKLRKMITLHIISITSNPTVGAAMVFEIRSLLDLRNDTSGDDDFNISRDNIFALRDKFEAMFRQTVREGIECGDFRAVDAAIFTKMMLGAQNWVGVWYKEGGRLSGDDIATMMADNFLMALRI